MLERWAEHPRNWLNARDTDGSPIVMTKDELDPVNPIKPFPIEQPQIGAIVDACIDHRMLFIPKPRQILGTWTVLLVVDWFLRFRPAQLWLLSKSTEDEAKQLMRDKIAHMHGCLPAWVQAELPLKTKPQNRFTYPLTGGQLLAVAENAAEREFRGNTASGICIDEAAFQMNFREMVAAAAPMNGRVIALSTANLGNPGAQYCREIMGISHAVA